MYTTAAIGLYFAMYRHRSAPAILTSTIWHKLGLTVTIICEPHFRHFLSFFHFGVLWYKHLFTVASFQLPVAHTFLSSRPISVSDDIFIVLQGSRMIMSSKDLCLCMMSLLSNFCLIFVYHHFLPLMAVVCPSLTPSVDSGINRILTVANTILKSSMILG